MLNTIHTLWTGGLDSTARIVYLSRQENISIQPYYVIDPSRASTPLELQAMHRITDRLRNDPDTKARLNDLIIIRISEIAPDAKITNAWKRLNARYGVGSQYDFLARYARQHDITLEIGIEKGEGRAQTAILAESKMISVVSQIKGGG